MFKDLIKSSAIYGIAPFVPKILMVLLLPILTKYLTSVDYGIIGTITSITFAVQALQTLGINAILPTYFYRYPGQYKIIWRQAYGFLSLWMIIYAIIQAVLLYFFIPKEAESNKWLIIILSNFSTVFFGPTALLGQTYYQLKIEPVPVAIRIVIAGIITTLANFLCVVVFHWGYMGAYVGTFAGTFFTNMSYWPVVNRRLGLSPIYLFKWRTIKRLLKVGVPTIPHFYTGYLLNTSNIVAMNYHGKPQSEIGQLTMAQQISGMMEVAINAINQVFSPMSFKNIKENKPGEIRKLLYVYILIAFSITFLYSIWSREAYSILISNNEIAATYKYSIFLAMAFCYRPFYVYCANYFFYYEHTAPLLGISFTAGIISCLIYFSLIPVWGVYAALCGFYIGCLYYGYSGYLFKFYRKNTLYRLKWYYFPIFQILLTFAALFLVDSSIFIKIVISLIWVLSVLAFFLLKVRH